MGQITIKPRQHLTLNSVVSNLDDRSNIIKATVEPLSSAYLCTFSSTVSVGFLIQ